MRGIQRFMDVLADNRLFKSLTDEQRTQFFADNDRCRVHGDHRCRYCSCSARVTAPSDTGGKE